MLTSQFKKKLISGGAWIFIGKLLTAIIGLIINVLLARLLSPEEMGAYFLTFSLVSFFAIVSQLGLTQTIVKLIAESMGTNREARAKLAIRLAMRLFGVGLIVVISLMAYGGVEWIAKSLLHSVIIAQIAGLSAIWMALFASQKLIAEIYRGFHDIKLATIFSGLITSTIAMLLFFIIWFRQGDSSLQQVIFLTLIAGSTSLFISSLLLWKKLSTLSKPKGSEIYTTDITKISLPIWITNLMLFALAQTDIWIMGLFSPTEEVAIYGASSRMLALISMPLMIVNGVVPPIIAEMHALKRLHELEDKLRKIATLTGIPSIFAITILAFYADSVLTIFFGEYYKSGGTILIILGLGQLINVWAGSCGQVLMLTGSQKTMMTITLFCGSLTIILAWWLVQLYSGIGVAIAGAISMGLQNILMLFFVKKKIGIWTHVDLKNCLLIIRT